MRVVLMNDEQKNVIREMYSNIEVSGSIKKYLIRNYFFYKPIDVAEFPTEEDKQKYIEDNPWIANIVKIVINDKSYTLNDDKKGIKNRIYNDIEDDIERIDPTANKAVVLKTIKVFLDNIIEKLK